MSSFFLSLIGTLSLDLGPSLIQYELVLILTVIIFAKTLFLNKVTFCSLSGYERFGGVGCCLTLGLAWLSLMM